MRRNSVRMAAVFAVAATLCATAAWAGGFIITAELPGKSDDPRLKGAVLIVTPDGCHGPGASLKGTAEGIVNGERRSVPLRFRPLTTNAVGITRYALTRQWPNEGVWVLSLQATEQKREIDGRRIQGTTYALIEVAADGGFKTARHASQERRYVESKYPAPTEVSKMVEASLRSLEMSRPLARRAAR